MVVVESGHAIRQHLEQRFDCAGALHDAGQYARQAAFLSGRFGKQLADRIAEFGQTRNAAAQSRLQARQACRLLPGGKGGDQSGNDRIGIGLGIGVGQLAASDLLLVAIFLQEGDAGFRLGAFACQLGDCLRPRHGRRLTEGEPVSTSRRGSARKAL